MCSSRESRLASQASARGAAACTSSGAGAMPTAPSVGSDVGASAHPARGRVAAGAIEAVSSGARVRRCHALARGHFPRGAKGGVLREPANILVHGEAVLRRDG